jgi:hypothetical protein
MLIHMVKLDSEKALLEDYLEDYKDNHAEIYDKLVNIAKGKYLKGDGVKEFREQFFIDFIVNGEGYNNYENLYHHKSHLKLIKLRRKIDPNFMLGYK